MGSNTEATGNAEHAALECCINAPSVTRVKQSTRARQRVSIWNARHKIEECTEEFVIGISSGAVFKRQQHAHQSDASSICTRVRRCLHTAAPGKRRQTDTQRMSRHVQGEVKQRFERWRMSGHNVDGRYDLEECGWCLRSALIRCIDVRRCATKKTVRRDERQLGQRLGHCKTDGDTVRAMLRALGARRRQTERRASVGMGEDTKAWSKHMGVV